MTAKQTALLNQLTNSIPESDADIYREIASYLAELGYAPQKQKTQNFTLSFKHNENNKVIAKMGANKKGGFIRLKFFACKIIPPKYIAALRSEIDSHNEQYCSPIRSQTEKNRCGFCDSCTGGQIAYYYKYQDGREILRCGAYPIEIPDVDSSDIDEMKNLILEQHAYFLSIA
jgi:hypothetical protein